MFESFRRERNVRKALRQIAGQRAVLVLNPGNVYVIENSPNRDEGFQAAVLTARIRGWADVLFDAIPSSKLEWRHGVLVSPSTPDLEPHYRLTEGGWAAINRTHAWTVATFVVSVLAMSAAVVAAVVAWPK